MSILVSLEKVSKIYQSGENQLLALNNIDFQLQRGEMTAIVGVSGSGKSTLMNIIGFLDQCSSGQYYFNGEDVSHLNDEQLSIIRNQKIGFVFQSFFLLPRSTALENVMLPLFYRGMEREQSIELARLMLEKMGVGKWIHHRPNQLSGGQQQRVAIARALVGNPDIILADEPTGALDSQTSHDVMRLLTDLNENEGRTILLITHDNDISKRCRRTVCIQDGQFMLRELLAG